MTRIAFFGTPTFAADILLGILQFPEIEVACIVSQPDMPVGRKQELLPTPVKQVALEKRIEVLQPESLKRFHLTPYPTFPQRENEQAANFGEILQSLNLDFIVVVAYGKIIPKSILKIPKYGCINIHGSILSKYRGASPVQECLKNGDTETGLTTMYMSQAMDEGDILQIAKVDVDIHDKTPDIFQKFVDIGPELLRNTLQKIKSGELQGTPQNHAAATYCSKIDKEDGKVSFQTQTASRIYNLFRAYASWPGIYTLYEGKRVVIEECQLSQDTSIQLSPAMGKSELQYDAVSSPLAGENGERCCVMRGQFLKLGKNRYGIVCADGNILELKQVKPEGKKSMDISSFVNGNKGVLEYRFA